MYSEAGRRMDLSIHIYIYMQVYMRHFSLA